MYVTCFMHTRMHTHMHTHTHTHTHTHMHYVLLHREVVLILGT